MPFFAIQKKPLFNRGFHREILKVAIFDPPQGNPQKSPKLPFLTTFWTPKNPQKPQKPPKWPKFQKMALFDQICLFGQKLWRFDKQNPPFWPPLGDSPPPQKWPFLTPPGKTPKNPRFWRFLAIFWSKSEDVNGFQPPWPDFLYLIIGLLGRKFGICAENEDFLHPAQVRDVNPLDFWLIPRLLPKIEYY